MGTPQMLSEPFVDLRESSDLPLLSVLKERVPFYRKQAEGFVLDGPAEESFGEETSDLLRIVLIFAGGGPTVSLLLRRFVDGTVHVLLKHLPVTVEQYITDLFVAEAGGITGSGPQLGWEEDRLVARQLAAPAWRTLSRHLWPFPEELGAAIQPGLVELHGKLDVLSRAEDGEIHKAGGEMWNPSAKTHPLHMSLMWDVVEASSRFLPAEPARSILSDLSERLTRTLS